MVFISQRETLYKYELGKCAADLVISKLGNLIKYIKQMSNY